MVPGLGHLLLQKRRNHCCFRLCWLYLNSATRKVLGVEAEHEAGSTPGNMFVFYGLFSLFEKVVVLFVIKTRCR